MHSTQSLKTVSMNQYTTLLTFRKIELISRNLFVIGADSLARSDSVPDLQTIVAIYIRTGHDTTYTAFARHLVNNIVAWTDNFW